VRAAAAAAPAAAAAAAAAAAPASIAAAVSDHGRCKPSRGLKLTIQSAESAGHQGSTIQEHYACSCHVAWHIMLSWTVTLWHICMPWYGIVSLLGPSTLRAPPETCSAPTQLPWALQLAAVVTTKLGRVLKALGMA
jgi:hypothetical protein